MAYMVAGLGMSALFTAENSLISQPNAPFLWACRIAAAEPMRAVSLQ
jgi:hypothetical protein